ncbi:SURF1 family protein [Streptomyces rapamycinicus]|uniref:SURF1-like protein n=1 Tax=Streptomyces rapamycinicus TaxID=1226757 RepID=A0ABR6LPT3_9ACTN|nr:SURF1 family protein [Streptomyces rapamycinicus]MBB4784356.1 cytochrome oxidase assembly protein ShyY1 [Streptomyces rapamycinicus]UTO64675.1 SURF1 family protein [Streptomyces rapamycinicus]UTP32631.1 SURF1 family protein [Streptomyces rapamycinicus NRRL 5491]
MYRFLLTPRWWVINVFTLLAIPVCLFMGSWQLSRFETRVNTHNQQQDEASAARKAAARPLGDLLPVTAKTSGERATATGRYDTAHQLLVPDRRLDGRDGFYVLTLLRVDEVKDGAKDEVKDGAKDGAKDGGKDGARGEGEGKDAAGGGAKALPVVRGWLPGDADDPAVTAKVPAPPSGEVTVTGALQASEHQGGDGVSASGGLPRGQLGMISAASLVNLVPYQVYDAWVTSAEAPGALKPVPPTAAEGTGLDIKAFQNLGYTGEWFVFAGFVVFMWFRLFRREAETARDLALGITPPEPTAPAAPGADPTPDDAERTRSPSATA